MSIYIYTLIGQLNKSFYFSSAAKLAFYKAKEIDENQWVFEKSKTKLSSFFECTETRIRRKTETEKEQFRARERLLRGVK